MQAEYFPELVQLTPAEQKRRNEIEATIFETVRQSYITIGELLCEIGQKGLYKSSHRYFDDYCRDVLDMMSRRAYQYIEAFEVAQNLSSFIAELPEERLRSIENKRKGRLTNVKNFSHSGQQLLLPLLPQNDSQARALVGLTPEEQREVWLQALESAPEGKVTAAHVRATVRTLKGGKITEAVTKAKRAKAPNSRRIGAAFQEAFKVFLDAVQAEIDSNWATTDRLTVIRHLDGIRGAISENGHHTIPNPGYRVEASNTEKLLDAGYNIYRMLPAKLIIERLIGNDKWEIIPPIHQNTESLTKAFEELMLDQMNLRA